MYETNAGCAATPARLLAALALACLPAVGRGELITPQDAGFPPYVLANSQVYAGPALTTEYRASGLLFGIDWVGPRYGNSVVKAVAVDGYVPVWVGASHWWHVPPMPVIDGVPRESGLWADAINFSPIEASLTSPADSLRVTFLWGGVEGTATVTGYTRDGGLFTASASGVGGATVSLDAPGIERFTATASGPLEYWGVSALDVQFQAVPEPGGLILALLGGAGLAARIRRRH